MKPKAFSIIPFVFSAAALLFSLGAFINSTPSLGAATLANGHSFVTGSSRAKPLSVPPGSQWEIVSAPFTVPADKTANIAFAFTGEVRLTNEPHTGSCWIAFRLDSPDGQYIGPSEWMVDAGDSVTSVSGFKKLVPAGSHRLFVTVSTELSSCIAGGTLSVVGSYSR